MKACIECKFYKERDNTIVLNVVEHCSEPSNTETIVDWLTGQKIIYKQHPSVLNSDCNCLLFEAIPVVIPEVVPEVAPGVI
jgi:hypothetical protein